VVSQRFKEILLQLEPSYFEFHSVQLICTKTSEVDTSYSLLNILNKIQCFDWERSEFRTYPTAPQVILGVSRLVVREDTIQDRNIVRMEELPTVILVSARLKQQIETTRLTGIQFMQLENYRT
jgi:hypothetical protein